MDVARKDGAAIAAGGAKIEGAGYFFQPTLFSGADQSMRVAQEEIFGPVLTAIRFTDEADAIAKANDVRYGLAAYLWTSNLERALRVSDALEAGMVWVNSENIRHLPTPFGGVKASGIGRDGGDWSFDFYMETKNVALARGNHKGQRLGV
jgi:5-carboxymethyl-2-hydroxymuconic-semialdehyde dehydrogenase